MRVEFCGVRGTFPGMGRERTKIGINTPCARIHTASGETVIIDAGTGIRTLGESLLARAPKDSSLRLSILFTHFHLDHVFGLPFFGPLYDSRTEIAFYSKREPEALREILGRLTAAPLFPAAFEETPSRKSYHQLGDKTVDISGLAVSTCPLHHPQGCVAFRLEEGGRSIVFATDTEHPAEGLDERLAEFARRTSILVYDAMYTPEEYAAGRQGWGHSTWLHGARLARAAGAGRLLLSHFNPDHDDRTIRRMRGRARKAFASAACATEGSAIEV